jgi:predicted nucleotidyltransferase component of viral defense system
VSNRIIQHRLLSYQCQTVLEQENALKEIAQEIALLALSRTNFFKVASFQGGTCLRILYGLERFSEDLDFILDKSDPQFDWKNYLENMAEEFSAYGFTLEIQQRQKVEKTVKSAFLKTNSLGGILLLKDFRTNKPKMRIKLEIDSNPPAGSQYELKYLDFPLPFAIKTQDMPSLFAGKCHALLCREYVKGRDWYDFIWYISRKTPVNYQFLQNALNQVGPWQGKKTSVTDQWLIDQLKTKIQSIDWKEAKLDVAQFLRPNELASLSIWSEEFFLSRLDKVADYHQ